VRSEHWPGDAALLRHEEAAANNAVRSELHSRASFAVSCLSLVIDRLRRWG